MASNVRSGAFSEGREEEGREGVRSGAFTFLSQLPYLIDGDVNITQSNAVS